LKDKCNNKDVISLENNNFVNYKDQNYFIPTIKKVADYFNFLLNSQLFQASFFGAQKFCKMLGFNLATLEIDENVANVLSNKGIKIFRFSVFFTVILGMTSMNMWTGAIKYDNALTKNQSTFWPISGNVIKDKKTKSNLKFSCLAAKVSEPTTVFEEDCKTENLFLCSVPYSCVRETCPGDSKV